MVGKIACFLTCGYTESGAMQYFLRKINRNYEYKQFLPNKTIKKKGTPKVLSKEISGLTGEKLLDKIYSIISKHKTEIGGCKAILIEDDLDGRFYKYSAAEIREYQQKIVNNVCERLGMELPVFILYASPEIESWFIADWKYGFEYLYCGSDIVDDMDRNVKLFFSHHLKEYIMDYIVKGYSDNIEEYGWFEESYVKLSDQIKSAVQSDVKEYLRGLTSVNSNYVNQIIESRKLYYSKKLHGDIMLRNIRPAVVAEICKNYFRTVCNEIVDFKA